MAAPALDGIDELLDLTEAARPRFSLEAIARGYNGKLHVPQLGYTTSLALRILKRCSPELPNS